MLIVPRQPTYLMLIPCPWFFTTFFLLPHSSPFFYLSRLFSFTFTQKRQFTSSRLPRHLSLLPWMSCRFPLFEFMQVSSSLVAYICLYLSFSSRYDILLTEAHSFCVPNLECINHYSPGGHVTLQSNSALSLSIASIVIRFHIAYDI